MFFFFPSPSSSDISTAVQLCGLWKKMAAHPRACYAQQILLVSHLFFFLFFISRLHSSSPKFCLFRSAEAVVRVPSHWASDIDGSERGASPAGDATGISAHFPPFDTAGQRLISPLRTLFAFSVWQHVTSIPQTRPAHIRQINKNCSFDNSSGKILSRHIHAPVQFERVWLIMDPGRPCHFLSSHICYSHPLRSTYSIWKLHTHHKRRTDLFQLVSSRPLWGDLGLPLATFTVTCINLELPLYHCGIILNNVHNPSLGLPFTAKAPSRTSKHWMGL